MKIYPCPFCKEEGAIVTTWQGHGDPRVWRVVCPCGLHGPSVDEASDPQTMQSDKAGPYMAIERWNYWYRRDNETERLRNEVASLRLTLGGKTFSADVPEPIGCPMPGSCAQVNEIKRLRNGINAYLSGDYSRPRNFRPHGCDHGTPYYEECATCDIIHFQRLLGHD